jgi:sugar/nucleoside kinase (ribokinase family)
MTGATNATPRRGIISACSWTVDRIKFIDSWPQQEHLVQISGTDKQGGGCGYNLAVDIRQLDPSIPVEAIGAVGADADGQFLIDAAQKVGIDTRQLVRLQGLQTSFTDVMTVVDSGRRTFFHHAGAHDHITPDHFDFSRCRGRILHLGLLGVHAVMDSAWQEDANGWVAVLRKARSAGIQCNAELVSIEAERIRRVGLPCVPLLDTLIINEYELSALCDSDVSEGGNKTSVDQCITAATQLLEYSAGRQGATRMIVVHCPDFAIAVSRSGEVHTRRSFTIDSQHIVSSVGAGDAFAAGMLYGIHQQWDTDTSLELAHAVAAASLRSSNAVGTVESVAQCLQYARGL